MATSTAKFSDFIGKFKSDLTTYTNETQKKERFIMLMTQLFPTNAQQIAQLTQGAEAYTKYLKGTVENESKYGFIDTLYGQLVIEFEFDLKRTGPHAEQQLREYVAKLWSDEKVKTDFVCISTDGLDWKIFTPRLNTKGLTTNQFASTNIDLIPNEPYQLTDDYEGFYHWLDRIFFRENRLAPQSKVICAEFGSDSPHFSQAFNGLMEVFRKAIVMKEVRIAVENWRKYLKYTYGDIEASDELFVTHTYLSGFIKLLMANFFSANKKTSFSEKQISQALTGKFFFDLNVRNYVEKDFFFWINFNEFSEELEKIWRTTFSLLKTYDFSKIGNDFLKDIYQGMVDPKDRHDLGEHYTPDWLCEKIIIEALEKWKDKENLPRLSDITCGSGSFLRIAIKLLRKRYFSAKGTNKNKIINAITKNVIGFEIHPLAAFIAKTNYMLAMEDILSGANEPFHIPIYLCDSLLNSESDKMDPKRRTKFAVQLAGKKFELPLIDALTDERFDNLIDYIDDLAHTYKVGELPDNKIKILLTKKINEFLPVKDPKHLELLDATTGITKVLHDKVLNHENTIWSFVLKNNFRPFVFNNSMDIVVGNPPWLSFQYVKSPEYRNELEQLGLKQHSIAPSSAKLRANMELATIFLAHAASSYTSKGGLVYFVLPRSVFSSDNHSNFREQTYTVSMCIEELWDLQKISPLFLVPSCVVIVKNSNKVIKNIIPGRNFSATFPSQNLNWKDASSYITEKKAKFHLVKLNKRTAFSSEHRVHKSLDTHYISKFKKGATIFPRNYYFVETSQARSNKKVIAIRTDQKVSRNAKQRYKSVNLQGMANSQFLFDTLLAENVLPFTTTKALTVHLPVAGRDKWSYYNSKVLLEKNFRDSSKWFQEVEKSYKSLSENKMSFFERINYHNGLFCQNPKNKYWVLYCTSGKHMCASVYINKKLFWAEHKTYWWCPPSKKEAYYLAGVLNSPSLNKLIKPFQSMGLLGERDINKKILDVGIPKFNSKNITMLNISRKSEALSKKIEPFQVKLASKSVGAKRNQIRTKFKNEFDEIDKLVMKLFK
jgi:hypothetical protein